MMLIKTIIMIKQKPRYAQLATSGGAGGDCGAAARGGTGGGASGGRGTAAAAAARRRGARGAGAGAAARRGRDAAWATEAELAQLKARYTDVHNASSTLRPHSTPPASPVPASRFGRGSVGGWVFCFFLLFSPRLFSPTFFRSTTRYRHKTRATRRRGNT